jgi:hypothetical protein
VERNDAMENTSKQFNVVDDSSLHVDEKRRCRWQQNAKAGTLGNESRRNDLFAHGGNLASNITFIKIKKRGKEAEEKQLLNILRGSNFV